MRGLLAVYVVLGATMALAAESTTAPVQADLSSPKQTLQTLATAIKAGDLETAKSVFLADDPELKKLKNVGLEWLVALEKLVQAAEKKFGDGTGVALRDKVQQIGPATFVPDLEKLVPNMPDSETQDAKVVAPPGDNPDLHMTRVEGQWKIDLDSTLEKLEAQKRQEMLRGLPEMTKKLKRASEALDAGKFSSVDELEEAMGLTGQ